MVNAKKILLVEGEADRSFFEKICQDLKLDASVKVAAPKHLGGAHNSKEGVFQRLAILLPQLVDGSLTHIAVVVDADHVAQHGLGYQKTVDRISKIVEPFGFMLNQNAPSGLCFNHSDGLADFGLWVMPDNHQDGMLEDWIKSCINKPELALFQQAADAVQAICSPKFPAHLTTKAEVATWLAWQKQPGHGLYGVVKDQLLDGQCPLYEDLVNWLRNVFP